MTFSLLARDLSTGALGGAAATGSLCVGGWVLRGDSRAGMSASQGAAPSTMWGEDVLEMMRAGTDAETAVARLTGSDHGRSWRQLAAIGRSGPGAAFTGKNNTGWRGSMIRADMVAAGNMLTGPGVLEALFDGFSGASGTFPERLLAALRAAEAAGGDSRGLQSAALLVVSDDSAPLTLRVDWAEAPLDALAELLGKTREPPYATWFATVPTRNDPERGHD
jgi:uncharacterized Ntn-hydrolase superfamily protein